MRHGVPRARRAQGLHARARARRAAGRPAAGPMELQAARDQGHRRRAALPHRPLRGRRVDLRHRLRVGRRRGSPSEGPRPEAHRSPHAQRLPRPHGVLGGLLREDLQLPRDPLLRHQGRVHRPHVEGDDRARRQDPHSAERGSQEVHRPDRGIPDAVQRRGHPAHRAAHRRPRSRRSTACARRACR